MVSPIQFSIDTSMFDNPAIPLPMIRRVRQQVGAQELTSYESEVRTAFKAIADDPRLQPGASVAVGVGSRGIANLARIVRIVIEELKSFGCEPFIVPAMGSHGDAKAENQRQILAEYGVSEAELGVPVKATMEVVQVGQLASGYPVYLDRNAYAADAILVINRIKPHTDFQGEIESGLGKMCAIGLGKQFGASAIHRHGAQGLREILPQVARTLVEKVPIVGGIGIIENAAGRTAEIHGVPASGIASDHEKRLLKRARELSPRLPFDQIDVLVVDEMGKDISGSGMDTHVIGRLRMPSQTEDDWDGPKTRIVCVLGLTEHSMGNAAGIGLADMTTRQLIEGVDWHATMTNHATSGEGGIYRGSIPLVLDSAEACVRAAIHSCGRANWEEVRLVRIRNTECVSSFEVSSALWQEVENAAVLGFEGEAQALNVAKPLDVDHREQ